MQKPPNLYPQYPQQQWSQIKRFSRVIPSWEQIEQFKQPLTEDERYLLKFLDDNLKKDDLFQVATCLSRQIRVYDFGALEHGIDHERID